jgi:hypothetical protein
LSAARFVYEFMNRTFTRPFIPQAKEVGNITI